MSEVKYKLKEGLTGGMFSSCKWDVSEWSEAQKTLWQGAMFELGYVWSRAGQNVDNLNKRYYYTNNPYMCYSECGRNYFEQQTNKQKYFSDVFDVVGEEEETSTDDVLIFNKSVDTEEELLAKVGLPPKENKPHKPTGGSSKYYEVVLPEWLLEKQTKNGYIMLEDLAEVMFGNNFNYVNVMKAQKRMYEMENGGGKEGNTFGYDADKVKYYTDKQVEVFNRK